MKHSLKTAITRCVAILIMILSVAFGVTWKGYCIGDNILAGLGLMAWSNGTQGLHYTAICSLLMLLIAFPIYAATTNDKRKFYRYVSKGFCAVVLLAVFVNLLL